MTANLTQPGENSLAGLNIPAGPPPGAALDPALSLLRSEQAAEADARSGITDADGILALETPLPYPATIESDTRVKQAGALPARITADQAGTAIVLDIKQAVTARPAPSEESPESRRFRLMPLHAVVAAVASLRTELTGVRERVAVVSGYLSGKTTDGSGTDLSAHVPDTSSFRYWLHMNTTKLFWVAFEAVMLWFTLRLTTRTDEGAFQVVAENVETWALVFGCLLVTLVAPGLMSGCVLAFARAR